MDATFQQDNLENAARTADADPGRRTTAPAADEQRRHFAGDPRNGAVIKSELLSALLTTLSFENECDAVKDQQSLYRLYVDSLAELESRREEILQLVNTMKSTSVEFDFPSEVIEEARDACDRMLASEFEVKLEKVANISSATLASLPVDELRERFRAALRSSAERLISQLISGFDNLVDRKVVGLAHWPSGNAVKYTFFTRRVYCEDLGSRRTRGRVKRRAASEAPEDFRRWKRVSKRISSTNCICSAEHHTHEAINAYYTSIENTRVVMPAGVEALVEAVPAWMKPSIRIIDGYLVGERIHSVETCREQVVREETIEEPLHGHEPAVLLGPYVLAGWGPREIEETLALRREAEEGRKLEENRRFWVASAVAVQVLTALSLIAAAHPAMLILASGLFLLGIPATALALRHHLACRNLKVPEPRLQLLVFGIVGICFGLQVLVAPIGLIKFSLAILTFCAGAAIVHPQSELLFDSTWKGKEKV